MCKSKQTIKRQLAVIEDLFAAELDEQEVLRKHGVKPALYRKWLADEQFMKHFEQRRAQAYHSSRMLLARYASLAATRLVELTMCDQKETARKACLDVITAHNPDAINRVSSQDPQGLIDDIAPVPLSPETASRILAALVETPPEPVEQ